MDSCRFDLPEWLPPNTASSSAQGIEMPDELQLAGILGKTLLERNADLQAKLKRLEESTEETLTANRVLSRQLKEYRESLHFANKSCEHLEQRLEESESEIKQLKLANQKKEATLHVKARTIEDLQSLLENLESNNMQLQEDLKTSIRNSPTDLKDGLSSPVRTERSHSCVDTMQSESEKELHDLVEDLTKQLSDLRYQKSKAKSSYETITSENRKLRELLGKAESEVVDLQIQVKFLEDLNNDGSEPATPIPPTSPGRRSALSSLSHAGGSCPHCNGSLLDYSYENSFSLNRIKSEPFIGSDTLFTELQNELNTVQISFDKLLQNCTCPASIPYKDLILDTPILLDTPPPCGDNVKEQSTVKRLSNHGRCHDLTMKDLFDEVYASLKQSSIVADQLLTRKNDKTTP